jgi:hypothetical protein
MERWNRWFSEMDGENKWKQVESMRQFLVINDLALGRKRVRHGDGAAFNPSVLGCFAHPLH